jgi:hypothetical protein
VSVGALCAGVCNSGRGDLTERVRVHLYENLVRRNAFLRPTSAALAYSNRSSS